MVEAQCKNEECEHSWELTKPPETYSRGVTCPKCGSSRTEYDSPEPSQPAEAQQAQPQNHQPAPAQPVETEQPVPQEQPQQSALPAQQQTVEQGMQIGKLLLAANSDDPQKRGAAKGSAFQMAGAALASMGEGIAQQEMQRNENAKNTSQDQIRKKEEYPTCLDCGTQLRGLPEVGEEFQCGACGLVMERT